MLKFIMMTTITLFLSATTNANTIIFKGSIVEETCSSSSDNKTCVSMYDSIKVKSLDGSTVAELRKFLNKQSNGFANVEVDKIEGNNNAVIVVNYF